ncbi:MAG: helix-turn-helix transcriptional regulator [Lentisphaeria bacterium]|nr:helix-turn-helix transcriptional regulator [Lentisphaeria bacterium]
MNYFGGIEFICHGDITEHTTVYKDRCFDGYYGIQYNHAGNCLLQIDNNSQIKLSEGSGFFSAPGRSYTYGAPAKESRHHSFICFCGPRVNSFIEGKLFDPYTENPVFKVSDPEQFYRHILELHHLLLSPSAFRIERKIHLLEGLLLLINESGQDTSAINPFLHNSIEAIRKKIMEKPQKNWDFAEEAKKISVSYAHFRRIFRKHTGFAPKHFLIECRLNQASKMLLESNLPINEIAHACGYDDEFYFYRIFKQYRFCTALNYRKNLANR